MGLSNKTLFDEITSIQIGSKDDGLSFVERLARENNWSPSYAEKCFLEYKKFVYLSRIAVRHITPSDQVDQAWHLHLTYSRSYWEDLCKNILKTALHHEPTKGGSLESARFLQQYQYTLELYALEFDEKPPADIWPDSRSRFAHVDKFIRVNRSKHWLIRKPSQLVGALLLLPVFLVACSVDENESELWFYVKLAIGLYALYKVANWLSGGGGGGKGTGGCGSACGGCGGCSG